MAGKKQIPAKGIGSGGGGEGFGAGDGDEKQARKDPMAVVKKNEQALGKVNVVYGAHDLDMELEGLTVAEIQLALKDLLNIDEGNVEAYVDGQLIPNKGEVKVKSGQRVEFMKEAGRKG
jgi:hypothetical protein